MPPNMIVDTGGAYRYFTQTTWVEILCINIATKFDVVGEQPTTKDIQITWSDKKRVFFF